ncbi:hypothetical protein LUW74_30205 [Actinomadura madurae]|uniref:hypothetical protein n=1 Tax=Actinomadura madurae TaxID=1993 RepID=UPI002027629F|nr:hypothetical protein [Actinomadura madurae]URN07177.1 hypothetical protein LUW74_30205 [Actinomadura madurae]
MVNRFLHDQQPPNPADALTAAQFVARMREFRSWSGLPYRQIQQRAAAAGFHLPHSTVAGALSRDTLPREDLLAAFITACGGDEPTVEQWLRMRRRLAVAAGRAGQERAQSAATILPATRPAA